MALRARGAALVALVLAAAFAASCGREPAPRAPTALARPPARTVPAPSATTPVAPSVTPPAPSGTVAPKLPEAKPIPRARLARPVSPEYSKKALPNARRIGRGKIHLPGIPSPDRVVIETATNEGQLLDAENGQALARFPQPRTVSPKAGVIVLEKHTPELLRLADSKRVRPVVEPDSPNAKTRWLAASPKHSTVVMLIEERDGRASVATSFDDKLEKLRASPLPFDADRAVSRGLIASDDQTWHLVAGGAVPSAGTPWFLPHEPKCVRAQLDPNEGVRCIEHAPSGGLSSPRWLSQGWVVGSDYVAHASWNGELVTFQSLVGQGHCFAPLTLANPPRAYVQCGSESALLSPDANLHLAGLGAPRVSGLLGADVGQVVPLLSSAEDNPRAKLWLDLPNRRVWETEPLQPLAVAAFAGVQEVALAEGEGREVWVLDFGKGTRETLGRIDDCKGELAELFELGRTERPRFLVLGCMTPPPPHTVRHVHIWSEVIDLSTRTRYRSQRLPEIVFDDGLVVTSTRTVVSAESKSAPAEIFSSRL